MGEGNPIMIFASQNEGGAGLVAQGIVTLVEPTPMKRGINRQTARVSITVKRTALAKHALGRNELKRFREWNGGRPRIELNFKLYRQATNKIVGIAEQAVAFLGRFVKRYGARSCANIGIQLFTENPVLHGHFGKNTRY